MSSVADSSFALANQPPEGGPGDAETLVRRMRDGDRDAAAEFYSRYASRIRRRIRGKLAPTMRRLFDSQEILSTVGRRLDLYVRNGQLEAANERQLWALLFKMADHALIDKARLFRRLEAMEGADGELAQSSLRRLRNAERPGGAGAEIEIDTALRSMRDPVDRQILSMWLAGVSQSLIAELLDIAPTAVRKRWQKIRERLRKRFDAGDL
jgi:DNA-directed RNA polymerase specialized sigma24 family protein